MVKKTVPSILVLADDLTGAAEIAAIGVEHGLPTELATTAPEESDAALLVIDTDTRPMSGADAASRISAMVKKLPAATAFFKKIDSVLRGQVVSEVRAIQQALGRPAALVVPQNPSKGRIIVDGQYLVDGVPLDQTSFRNDPEYPRTTASVLSLLTGPGTAGYLRIGDLPKGLGKTGITVGNAVSAEEISGWAAAGRRSNCVVAGGADLFRAYLDVLGHTFRTRAPVPIPPGKILIVCGSTADTSRGAVEQWHRRGLHVCAMPEDPDGAACAKAWAQSALADFNGPDDHAILCIRHTLSPQRAVAFRRCMADAVRQIVSSVTDDLTLAIEGGATAAAIVKALGWTGFHVEGNLMPGVVAMRPLIRAGVRSRLRIILKPGSYPWPDEFPGSRASA